MTILLRLRRNRKLILIGLSAGFLSFASSAKAYTGEELAANAKIDIQTARDTALKARAGTITDEELEKEASGSGLRYSFDIKDGGKTYEVGIDAVTGKVLENRLEGKNPD